MTFRQNQNQSGVRGLIIRYPIEIQHMENKL